MAWTDDLTTARDNAASTLKDVLASPKPTYTVGDQTFEWGEYVQVLRETIASLTSMIDAEDAVPFEVHSEGVT